MRVAAAVVIAIASAVVGDARTPRDVDPQVRVAPETPAYVAMGDMLLEPEQAAVILTPPRVRTQANLVDYRLAIGAWDSGVVPYELDPAFSAAERQRILRMMSVWSRSAPIVFVPRTTQRGYVAITRDDAQAGSTPCFSALGQFRRAAPTRLNLGGTCASDDGVVSHELGHALGFLHEHARADRDQYISVDLDNVRPADRGNFTVVPLPLIGPYDFGSVMHYAERSFAIDFGRPVIVPHATYQGWARIMGTAQAPSEADHLALAILYERELKEPGPLVLQEAPRRTFQSDDLMLAMERLHAFYMSRYGLQRPQGLSIEGRPDFLGIAQWIFAIYIPARSAGISPDLAFGFVKAAITQSDEWRVKNPGRRPLAPVPSFTPVVTIDRNEYLDVMAELDRFYAASEGLQRPQGLSIAGGPDFQGIATWLFEVYLNERLRGTSAAGAWSLTRNAIMATDEWRRKH
jgi:hypothetical protein